MRKKNKLHHQGETAFLKKRRAAVSKAVTKSAGSKLQTPAWMRSLSSKLWSGGHRKEIDFNRAKLNKKRVLAYQAGHYRPQSSSEKRSLEQDLQKHEQREKKTRREWEKNISRCV